MPLQLKFKKLHPDAVLPKYATAGAACFDLHAVDCGGGRWINQANTGGPALRTGLAVEVPEGYVMLIYSRSGHGFKSGIRLANCTGVIDSDYRGEVFVKLHPDTPAVLNVNDGDRIAQAMLLPVQQVSMEFVEELSSTDRGTGGFGSTGK